ncbi:MAG: hypothetical protein JWP81_5353 [Ferruginibacter sp.]|nr:hypothetical protein [Ferruginibacter sp.]
MKKSHLLIAIAVCAATFGFYSCGKDNKNTTLNVRLTDNPVAFQEVNVDIREVRIKFSDDVTDNEWVTLTTHPGIYNLLTLQGVDTALATALVPSNTVRQIRFVLGPNNTVKDNGVVYPLVIPSGSESGLKIKISKELSSTLETLVIDFDAALSVLKEGTGDYKLRPVIKVK